MNFLPTLGEVLAAVDQYLILHAQNLPQTAQDGIVAAAAKVSPVDKIVDVAETLYAARAELDDEALILAGQVAEFATRNGWHGLQNEARGQRMVEAIRRQRGEEHPTGGQWPDPATDPAPAGAAAQGTPFQPMVLPA